MIQTIQTAIASFGMSGLVFHGPSLKANPGFQISKILERSKNLSAANCPEATIVRDFSEILDDQSIELVIVNTPDYLHYDMCKQALLAGKHVVVEKPFTQTVAQANELIALAKEKGLVLTVYQNRRWDGDFLTVKKLLEEQALGRLVEFESHFDRYRNFIQPDTWKEEGIDRVGVLYNLGSHMVDQVLNLFGMPKGVTAHLATLRTNGRVPDYYDIRLQYDVFAALLKSSYLVREPGPRYSLHGTLGSFQKWGIDPQEEALKAGKLPGGPDWGKEPQDLWGLLHTEKDGQVIREHTETIPGNYPMFYKNLYEAIVNGADLLVKPEESRDCLKVLEACLLSDREQRTILL
ncbi:Gfo/Idh/MocA family oxidoreductase [Mangrovibacterium diazotrophicum]|uniref:Putative dehydrogenase n=1 Tax=Mangrovibacterium diazotrophicum TaxID=1261403 RepID=A0A419W370_9BACT|nr:Gfo/Idh/MocA family oxidoreductase [Mangrovibacterium diazotrophicum]RKD89922.1 putative dehydrogenase [Mangrovibacterium diazotrophicum]